MPRIARIDAPGVLHHVMTRGIERREIFLDDDDRRDLLTRLERLVPEWGGDCFAWCLMPNHVHLLLRTGPQPLAKLMHRLNTGFAGRFNRRRGRVGYLFQNRFKSRPVVDESDLLHQIRYVHLNPVRAGLIVDLAELACDSWSGHSALVGARAPLAFEDVDRTLSLFDADRDVARRLLVEWMAAPHDVRASEAAGADLPWVEPVREKPRGKKTPPPVVALQVLIDDVCRHFCVSAHRVQRGGRDQHESLARSIIAHVAVSRLGLSMSLLADHLGVTRQAIGRCLARGAQLEAKYGPFAPREET